MVALLWSATFSGSYENYNSIANFANYANFSSKFLKSEKKAKTRT